VAAAQQQPARAAQLCGAAATWREAVSHPLLPPDRAEYDRQLERLRAALGEAAFAAAWAAGAALSLDQAAEYALAAAPTPDAVTRVPAGSPPEQSSTSRVASPLSEREREVLELLAEGLSNKEIAQRLVIAEATAKFHVRSLLNKLGANTRGQAVALAVQRGLL
jgi:non-specific serine/threonine protein kinase